MGNGAVPKVKTGVKNATDVSPLRKGKGAREYSHRRKLSKLSFFVERAALG